MKKQNNTFDAFLLAFMRVLTILVNLCSTAILSKNLSLDIYGTYASANLVINLFTNITQLGLMDAVNYFYHHKHANRKDSINTIFFLQFIIGIVCGGVILGAQHQIAAYFSNPGLLALFGYLAFRPLLGNLFNSMMVLQVAVGRAKGVAVRHAVFALAKLIMVWITSFITKDIKTILITYLVLDCLSIIYFYLVFKKECFSINPFAPKLNLTGQILKFAVPMGIYVMTNTFSRDIDKLIVGYFESTETLAVYTNCATLLPFDIISSAFLTIIIPIMTRLVQNGEYTRGLNVFKPYLKIGFISTSVIAGICIVLAEEVVLLLYGAKYIEGKIIFVLYTLVDVVKFAGVTIVLTAKGYTKKLMGISFVALVSNAVLNVLFYWLFGLLGPAIATVIVTLGTTVWLLFVSMKVLQARLSNLLSWKSLGRIVARLVIVISLCAALYAVTNVLALHYLVVLVVCGSITCTVALLLYGKELLEAFRRLNKEQI